ncbi:hypothetical protein LCGC14_1856020 [marine sediment metagenome]|uniref:DUF2190 domain-containing protein n=1 Tax=marine sediment metagenome TaxID=412755 RepID=A0A0F9GXC1_9ZZZZ
MTVTRRVNAVSFPAGGDLSSNQFCIVAMSAEGRVVVNGGMATANLGILLNKPSATDEAAEVAVNGSIVKMIASAAINENAAIAAQVSGHGSATTTNNEYIVGYARSPASGTGVLFEVLVDCDRFNS